MPALDPVIVAHLEWLGFVQPTGLVVSAPALARAGAILDRRDVDGQHLLRASVEERTFAGEHDPAPFIADFQSFARTVLGWSWSPKAYAGMAERPIPPELEVALPDYGETLRPDFAVCEPEPKDGASPWQLLVRVIPTGVQAGLLVNGRTLRLVSAPRGESSGWLDFHVAAMVQTAGRPISTALRLLLGQARLLALPRTQRLSALLDDSRRFQNEVSERLAEQVLHALYELLRGFQAAHDASNGTLLRAPLAEHPDEVYRALHTVILRLVFLLYAEERDMLPEDETFLRCYSLAGLYERLREDAALYPDTMDQRYGAWAQLLVLFRLVHDGAECGALRLPRRHGVLFDPDRFPFLEGRTSAAARQVGEPVEPPLVPDGTIYRALEKLLVLDGERISYRALDVEQIGSVYETMMGFRLETASGRSVAIRAQKKQGAPTAVDLEALLAEPSAKREKWLQDRAGRKLADSVKRNVAAASTLEDLHAALMPVVDPAATPDLVPPGAMVLQPSEERRRSGSHYTPRSLTEPIVRTTLGPVLARLGGEDGRVPWPEQILDLEVCDPAMGSGAFLVEACRQLGDALVEAWHAHGETPALPPDEDEVVFARRLVAQRCLYGVDRNPVAVDLAKVSLWLVTLAKDHALTFVDHALRHGDSLVGLSRRQIERFHWDADAKEFAAGFETMQVREHVTRVADLRQRIREADESMADWEVRDLWNEAQLEHSKVRLFGDLVVAAFFEGEKASARELKRVAYAQDVVSGTAERHRGQLDEWRQAERPLVPFHWEIEFPEVFERDTPGFDAFVGNPPFAGKNTLASANVERYPDWLKEAHEESHGNADLVAHFFRRAFNLVRDGGSFGLIATNTIAQGDTRSSGLRWICKHRGEIYHARKRVKWPGLAAVVVSVVHVAKGEYRGRRRLDEREVPVITAFLFHRGGHDDPEVLAANGGRSFVGSYVLGMGFTFDDTDTKGVASPLAEMRRLIEKEPRNQEVIFPYIGGEEVNTSPTHAHHRYVIDFGERSEEECRQRWPDLMAIVEAKVKPDRARLANNPDGNRRREHWWQFGRITPALDAAIAGLERVLVISQVGNAVAFAFLPTGIVFAHRLIVFPFSTWAPFASLQARTHETWARFFSYTLKDDFAYGPSDCFLTFPFDSLLLATPESARSGQAPEGSGALASPDVARSGQAPEGGGALATPDVARSGQAPEGSGALASPDVARSGQAPESGGALATPESARSGQAPEGSGALASPDVARSGQAPEGGGALASPESARSGQAPEVAQALDALEAAGKAYYEFRAALMVRNDEGLTKTYNRFHDPDERDPDIQTLRDLHAAMDRAVLDVYGWTDIPTHCEFLLDYEIDEEEWGTRKKPYRYRWPDEVRDEVLARLLELNAERAREEARSGAAAAKKGARKPAPKRPPRPPTPGGLF
jgi:hypothetical protein